MSSSSSSKTQRPIPAAPADNLSNNRLNNAKFDSVAVRKHYCEIDGVRYPENPIMITYNVSGKSVSWSDGGLSTLHVLI